MRRTGTFTAGALLGLAVAALGCVLWIAEVRARGIGRGADVLGYDPAQYAVAARELATHGRLATPFALPIELARHPRPPWPLALVQPGLVLVEAAWFGLFGHGSPDRAGLLTLALPFLAYLATAWVIAFGALRFMRRGDEDARWPDLGALVVVAAVLLDPETQQLATGGFTELPFTLGLAVAVTWRALARPQPFRFGLLLGVTGLFRGTMLWLVPMFALAVAADAPRRGGAFLRCLLGYALVLLPWWAYKASAFGTPAWDLSALSIWDGVQGRTWFSMNHLPEMPQVPHDGEAVRLIAAKIARNAPDLLLQLARGPRTLFLGALAIAAAFLGDGTDETQDGTAPSSTRTGHPRAAAWVALAMVAIGFLVAAASEPLIRYLMPARVLAEAMGLVAVWTLLWRMPEAWASSGARRSLAIAIAILALGWGGWQTATALSITRAAGAERGVPSSGSLGALTRELDWQLARDEPVMSNLGPTLAWYARRPIVHLALTPADIDDCRQRLPFRVVLLVFRNAARAWPGWDEVMERPLDAMHHPEWHVAGARTWRTPDGFEVVWLDLAPPPSPTAWSGR